MSELVETNAVTVDNEKTSNNQDILNTDSINTSNDADADAAPIKDSENSSDLKEVENKVSDEKDDPVLEISIKPDESKTANPCDNDLDNSNHLDESETDDPSDNDPANSNKPDESEVDDADENNTSEEIDKSNERDTKSLDNNSQAEEIAIEDTVKSISTDVNTTSDEPMEIDENNGNETSKFSTELSDDDNGDKEKSIENKPLTEEQATDDAVMENDPEELNCSDLSETVAKDKVAVIDDPFEAIKNSTNFGEINKNTEDLNVSSSSDDIGNDDTVATEQPTDSQIEVDDIDEGQGADEEVCLLPDEEREISDADKERAILAKEADENEGEIDNEVAENEIENDGGIDNNEEENVEKETAEDHLPGSDDHENDTTAIDQPVSHSFAPTLNPNEIKEIEQNDLPVKSCVECNSTLTCRYTFLRTVPSTEENLEANDTEIQFLCDTDCVTKFKSKNGGYKVIQKKVSITYTVDSEQKCIVCNEIKLCKFRFKDAPAPDFYEYICDDECIYKLTEESPDKYLVTRKRFIIEELASDTETDNKCVQCTDDKKCKFSFKQENEVFYLCWEACLNLLLAEQPDRFRIKRHSIRVKNLPRKTNDENCVSSLIAPAAREPKLTTSSSGQSKMVARSEEEARLASLDREASFIRRCSQCFTEIFLDGRSLQWETMDFCNESCLGSYQTSIGAACTSCQAAVPMTSLGKYCVRFGFELRQFCRSSCLDVYKKGLKVCSHCQKDISKNEEFLAPIGGQFKDFCSRKCMRLYEQICTTKKQNTAKICAVCNNSKPFKVEVVIDSNVHHFCSNPCFSAFKFVNNIVPDSCGMCKKYFERKSNEAFTIYQDTSPKMFCTKICMNIYIIANRKIAPCQWCKVRKYNFDMIQKLSQNSSLMLCSLNCLTMCEVSMNAISMKQMKCDQCTSLTTPQYHLTMSDSSIRNFCTYQCVMSFQSQFSRAPLTLEGESGEQASQPVPAGLPKRVKAQQTTTALVIKNAKNVPKSLPSRSPATKQNNFATPNAKQPIVAKNNNLVISSVTSLAPATRNSRRNNVSNLETNLGRSLQPVVELEPIPPALLEKSLKTYVRPRIDSVTSVAAPRVELKTQIVTVPPIPKAVSNVSTMCVPATSNKEIQCRPMQFTVGCQTESFLERKIVIPIPVPIYVPQPLSMYTRPVPIPIPIPLPIPVPIFIPTTRNSANGIMKEIKKIHDKMPADPFEAELLMMAEMVAGDKKKEETDSDTDNETGPTDYQPEIITENNAFGEDMLQMALKMATEYDDPAVDLESAMTANTITPNSHPTLNPGVDDENVLHHHHMLLMEQQRQTQLQTGKRTRGPVTRGIRQPPPAKRTRRQTQAEAQQPPPQPEPSREPIEKADANMCLKFTFGVNAWKQWIMTKNADLEKSSIRRKPFKSELLQMTADELNYSLCLFVKEVRKPNGSEYAPDTIYYLVLGIQQYLYENGRIDNIFTDPYYEKFTDCLDDVAKKFSVLYNDSQYIVTRVEEEHLWECKQLGAHSPHVLLSTLMFFNTKHFNLTTVEEHMQLSFSHIMKHWKRNPNQGSPKVPGSRNVLLRFYPPQTAIDNTTRKKKVYEQQENEENPLRCPVKLYEFYLSKCPESVKTRNDVFYLLPERSCVPDSPVWYSTQALGKEALSKMLHRVKMVKEINIALLTS